MAASAILDDQLYITHSGVAEVVSVYDTTSFQLLLQLTVPGLSAYPWGLATCSFSKHLYVSDYFNNCVYRVHLSETTAIKHVTSQVTQWKVASHPRGLSVNSARNVLVAFWELKKVQEYTSTGTLVREISTNREVWQAVELKSGILAIGQYQQGISTVSLDGQVINSYQIQSRFDHRCMTVSTCGCILIADAGNHSIHVVNPSLTDSRLLPLPVEPVIQDSWGLSLDQSRGRLYVGECSGQNRILVFDNLTNVVAMFNTWKLARCIRYGLHDSR